MAQANKHSLSRSGRDFDGCADLQPEKIPEVYYPQIHRNIQIMNLPKGKFGFWRYLLATASPVQI